jgi:hypothetical protein
MPQFRRHLKRWLLPHKHNDHRPHIIRVHGLAIMAVLVLGVQASAIAIQSAPTPLIKGGNVLSYATGSITPIDLLTLTNQDRAAAGLPALKMEAKLNQSASLKAQNMFAENYWAHNSPSGITPWYWFGQAGYNYTYAGENLAKDFDTSAGVNTGWMNSAGHKANILNTHYTEVGFAVLNGTLVGGQTTLVVAHYGTRPVAATPPPAVAPAATPQATVRSASAPPPTPVPASATPTPTATPSPSPTASATPAVAPTVNGQINPGAPEPQSYSLFRPLSLIRTLNWNTLVIIGLLLFLLIIYVVTHLAVWRKGLKRWQSARYRLYAASQVSGLAIAIILLSTSGFGRVG